MTWLLRRKEGRPIGIFFLWFSGFETSRCKKSTNWNFSIPNLQLCLRAQSKILLGDESAPLLSLPRASVHPLKNGQVHFGSAHTRSHALYTEVHHWKTHGIYLHTRVSPCCALFAILPVHLAVSCVSSPLHGVFLFLLLFHHVFTVAPCGTFIFSLFPICRYFCVSQFSLKY